MKGRRKKLNLAEEEPELWCRPSKAPANQTGRSGVSAAHERLTGGWNSTAVMPHSVTGCGSPWEGCGLRWGVVLLLKQTLPTVGSCLLTHLLELSNKTFLGGGLSVNILQVTSERMSFVFQKGKRKWWGAWKRSEWRSQWDGKKPYSVQWGDCLCACVCVYVSHSVMSDALPPHGL